ncbi:PEP-CTERM sorting domain-containing protein [Vibrio alfacsensis]|uniref:PEP-CTERM sorting domain-containing protein n=1 Tax=Vibrio alfacsensis TaxID=1074311 RepID=UPI004068A56C
MKFKLTLLFLSSYLLASPINAELIYDTWTTNEGESGNYQFTIDHNTTDGLFNYNLTVDPWNAEALGLFIDFGDVTMPTDIGLNNVSPENQVNLFATDTPLNDCGNGCNLEGLSPSLTSPDDQWELVFRLGSQGFDEIQTFSWTTFDFGLDLADYADDGWMIGVRSQQLCSGDALLPGGIDIKECEGSDKSFTGAGRLGNGPAPRSIPEPSSLLILGAGLFGLGFIRRKQVI